MKSLTQADIWNQVFEGMRSFGYSDEEITEIFLGDRDLVSKAAKHAAEAFQQYCDLVSARYSNKH